MSAILVDTIGSCHCESRFIGTWQSLESLYHEVVK